LTQKADEPTNDKTNSEEKVALKKKTLAKVLYEQYSQTPQILYRADWGAEAPNRPGKTNLGELRSIVIHHAAGSWDRKRTGIELVQAIQKAHKQRRDKNGNKWNDIGYHFLIDPNGIIYQGRSFMEEGQSLGDIPLLIRGAHTGGANKGRIGICLMGDYHDPASVHYIRKITPASKKALTHLLVFLHRRYKPQGDPRINVKGQTITGHQDFGPTSCPGDNIYKFLPAWDKEVKDILLQGVLS
ncbi:MAG: peptidoglycan recognition family protein, partial [Bacteroidota bacterium]